MTLAFGGQSNVAALREALLKAPGEAFGRAFDDPKHGFLHAPDLELAKREHAAFAELLASLGTKVHLLDEEIASPDLLYAYDPLIVTDRGAIPLRPGIGCGVWVIPMSLPSSIRKAARPSTWVCTAPRRPSSSTKPG